MKTSKLSDRQKNYAFIILVVASIVGILLGAEQKSDQVESQSQAVNSNSPELLQATPTAMTAISAAASESDVKKISVTEKVVSTNNGAVLQSGWILGDVKTATPTIPLNERIAQYEIVTIERPDTYPAVGQTISLPMFNGKNAVVNVQSTAILQNGDYTWSGHLDGFGDDYPVVMTYGEHSIFATITTPDGAYTMESTDGAGWLYKNPSEFELSNPGAKDYLEVTDI